MNKIAAVVILYYPEKSTVKNILSYSPFLDVVYAIDNSEQPSEEFIKEISVISNCIYIRHNENQGIARRLNEACNLAIIEGFNYLLTMDQDSFFAEKNIKKYLQCFSPHQYLGKVAMFGIEYLKTQEYLDCKWENVEQLITSGSIVNLSLFEKIGGFDEQLFIDEVDLEYCYNSIMQGFHIIQYKNIFLNHSLGTSNKYKSLKTFKLSKRILHSPERLYYMVRNFLYVNYKYKGYFQEDKNRRKKALLNRIKNNIVYSKQKYRVLKFIIKGIFDFKKNKMGKL